MTNLQIAELLKQVAAAYQYKDQNKYRFQIMAYDRAATSIEHATSELKDLWDDGKLDEVPGIGTSIAAHLDEFFKTGKSKHFESVMAGIPKEAFKLTVLPKVGIKTAMKMVRELSQDELSEKLKEAEKLLVKDKRLLLPYAENIAYEVLKYLKDCPQVKKIDVLGSLRRKVATVGDIDLLVASKSPQKVMDFFVKYPKAQKVIEKGNKTASILLPGGVQVDILITELEAYGNSLQHFTGSKMHNIALREHSLKRGWSMNEFRMKNSTAQIKKFKTEQEIYKFLDLAYIEPELREGIGEIKLAQEQKLPKLIQLSDVKSDLQIHSDFDIETSHDLGISSMETICARAGELGYEYIAFTEHNPSKKGHNSQEIENLIKSKREIIDQLNYSREKSVPFMFNSLEIDIGKDGSLPVSDTALGFLDFGLVSIHSVFDLDRNQMTKRVLKALDNPKIKIFAHPTARKINEREGIELDWEKIFDFCLQHDKWIEINADPQRLDLPDVLVSDAVKAGVKLTLGTDTHEVTMTDNMRYGVYVARRGGAERKDVVNTRSLSEFRKLIEN